MAVNAHQMIADLCSQMANTVYEELATCDNTWYKNNKDRKRFVQQHLENNGMLYVKEARKILGSMLNDPDLPVSEKDRIHEALTKDAMLRGSYDEKQSIPIL